MAGWMQDITWIMQFAVAVAALAAAFAAIRLNLYSKEQVQQSLEARYDQFRPLIVPEGELPIKFYFINNVTHPYVELGDSEQPIALHNIGPGSALSVRGVLYRPTPTNDEHENQRYVYLVHRAPITGTQSTTVMLGTVRRGRVPIEDSVTGNEDRRAPFVPLRTSNQFDRAGAAPRGLACLVTTYHDIFGRKHASIFDYTNSKGWIGVGDVFFRDLPKDIDE